LDEVGSAADEDGEHARRELLSMASFIDEVTPRAASPGGSASHALTQYGQRFGSGDAQRRTPVQPQYDGESTSRVPLTSYGTDSAPLAPHPHALSGPDHDGRDLSLNRLRHNVRRFELCPYGFPDPTRALLNSPSVSQRLHEEEPVRGGYGRAESLRLIRRIAKEYTQ
jgi:hypothetical protein